MSASRRLIFYMNVKSSSVRSIHPRNNYVSCFSSNIPHKYQVEGTSTVAEDTGHGHLYKTVEGDANAATGVKTPMEKEDHMKMDGPPRKTAADMAKEGAVGAMETGLKLGKVAKQTLDGVLEVAEKTTENVRDAVDDRDDDDIGGRRSDKFVEDLRRTAGGGGYDSKYRR